MSRQAADVRTTSAQHECRDRRLVICSAFVTVSSPDGKAHFLIGHETRDDCGQASEIRGTLRQELDMVAFGPRDVPWPTRVDLDHRVLPAGLDENGSASFAEDGSACLHADAKRRRLMTAVTDRRAPKCFL
jgi:hypothetical protein